MSQSLKLTRMIRVMSYFFESILPELVRNESLEKNANLNHRRESTVQLTTSIAIGLSLCRW